MGQVEFVTRHYDPYIQGHKGHNGVRQNSTWPISLCGDPYSTTVQCRSKITVYFEANELTELLDATVHVGNSELLI